MSVLEVEFVIPDSADELLALLGDPADEPQQPFTLTLFAQGIPIAKSPIGIYRFPTVDGEVIESSWPARFHGPLEPMTDWELHTHKGARVVGGRSSGPKLWKGEMMDCSLRLVGAAKQSRRRRWWQ